MRLPLSFVLAVAAFTQVGATDCGTILKDPGFELWCGDSLCSWKLLRGEVREAPTWHKDDTGVELIGTDVAISQLTPVTRSDGPCIRFDLVANVDENAEARLELDISGDGTIDHSERMPTSRWKPLSYKLHIQAPYSGIRFILSKKGTGKAVFAQIAAEIEYDGCAGLPEIVPLPAPLGAPCTDSARCASGICDSVPDPDAWFGYSNQCVGCTEMSCGTTEACGRGDAASPVLGVPVVCVGIGSRELGEQCLGNSECATDICTSGVCSTCATTCSGGELCRLAYVDGPSLCAAGEHLRTTNEPCAIDSDCASNRCNGAVRKQCDDGRVCDGPEDCPGSGLEPGACTAVGVQGGRCQ
jgi:hypothetical protein